MEVFEGNFSDNSDEEDFQEEYTNDVVSKELDINEFYKNCSKDD